MPRRIALALTASAVLATVLVLVFPSRVLAGTYVGPDVYCSGACPAPDQHCQPVNVQNYPIICGGSGVCPVGGNPCFAGWPCAYYATWDCQCYIEGGGWGGSCPKD
jgi:hypothetical protein